MSFHIFPSDKPHYPYELPKGWKWCKLGDIAYVGTGATPLTTCKYYYENGNIAWINSSSTKVPFIAKASNFITRKAIEETNCLVYPKGTLVIAMYGEGKTRGQISELLIDAATNQACAAVCPYFEATKEYLKLFFEGNYLHIRALAEGGNQPNLSLGKIQNYEIPLPPLDEQKRILEQAKKLLLQVENIEKEKEKNKNSIKQAKAKILNLAIHGKLVPHDLNDEPASELLRRINPKAEIISDNGHYQKLPSGWAICRLEDVVQYEQPTPYIVKSTNYDNSYKTPVLTAGKSFVMGYTNETKGIYTSLPCIIFDDFTTDSKLVKFQFKVKSSAMKILQVVKGVNIEYVSMFMSITRLIGDTHKRYWISEYSKIEIPIPPLEEQRRIVDIVELIFNKLDTISKRL